MNRGGIKGKGGEDGDSPITRREEDEFGFYTTSKEVVRLCKNTERNREGKTIGVTGKWGAGKTSVLNMAMRELEKEGIEVIEFNPWLRTKGEEIVQDLIAKVGKRITSRNKGSEAVRKAMEKYAVVVAEGAGEVIGMATHPIVGWCVKQAGKWAGRGGEKSTEEAKKELVGLLKNGGGNQNIIVVVDDIDRLDKEGIRGLVRGVRIVGDLPGVTYVMALDRDTTGKMLEADGWIDKGQEYLDKILEQEVEVPILQREQRGNKLEEILKRLSDEEKKERKERKGLDEEVTGPLDRILLRVLTTPRELKKFEREMETSARTVPTQVRWEDLLVLEAIKVATREVGRVIQDKVEDLCDPRWPTISDVQTDQDQEKDPEAKEAGEAMLKAAGGKRGGVREFITYLPRVDRALTSNDMGINQRGEEVGRKRGEIAHRTILEAALGRKTGDELEIDLKAEEGCEILKRGGDIGGFLQSEVGRGILSYVIQEIDSRIEPEEETGRVRWEEKWTDTVTELEEKSEDRETWWACWMILGRIWGKKTGAEKGGWLATRLERAKSFETQARLVNMAFVKNQQGHSKWDEAEIERFTQNLTTKAQETGIDRQAPTEGSRLIDTARILRRGLGENWAVWEDPAAVLKVIEGCMDIVEPRSRLMPLSYEARQKPSAFMREIWNQDTEALREAMETARGAGNDRQRRLVEKVIEALDHPEQHPFGP